MASHHQMKANQDDMEVNETSLAGPTVGIAEPRDVFYVDAQRELATQIIRQPDGAVSGLAAPAEMKERLLAAARGETPPVTKIAKHWRAPDRDDDLR
jgi:hypothetical protein